VDAAGRLFNAKPMPTAGNLGIMSLSESMPNLRMVPHALCARAAAAQLLRRLPATVKKRNLDAAAISNLLAAEILKGLGLKTTEQQTR